MPSNYERNNKQSIIDELNATIHSFVRSLINSIIINKTNIKLGK